MRAHYILATCLLPLVVGSALGQSTPQYGIKEDHPSTGSRIVNYAVGPVSIAINLPYEKLPAADRVKFHSYYERIADGDEPPFPREGLKPLLDVIRQAQAKLLVRGDLFLIATIGPDGRAQQVKAIGSPSPEMTKFAAQALAIVNYKPAVCSGKPCAMEFPLSMRFEVE